MSALLDWMLQGPPGELVLLVVPDEPEVKPRMTAIGEVAEKERLTSRRERIVADPVADSRRCEAA